MARRVPFVPVKGTRGMVTCPDARASWAGVAMLRAGGSAADAAIAANAVLAVTTQHMCGLGGDLFALAHAPGTAPLALNASGRAGSGADPERLRAEGASHMPFRGDIRSVPVPGCVDGWCAMHERFGRLPLADVFAPATVYARDGFTASSLLARAAELVAGFSDDYPAALREGDVVRRPGLAHAFEAIATFGRAGWYTGEFGERLVALGHGEYAERDLRLPLAHWSTPLRARVWDHDVWSAPPNSQGYITLAAASIAEALDPPREPAEARWAHLLIEAAKQAGYDRPSLLHEHADGDALIAPERLAGRVAAIDRDHASAVVPPTLPGGTIHCNATDEDGLAISLTQSNAAGFGAYIVVPVLGVFLHNRGIGFSLVPGHPAEYGPGRQPPHTLCPTIVTTPAGELRATLGTMGADSQPMILLQLLARLLHGGEDPATAVAAARWILATPSTDTFSVWEDPSALRVRVEADAPAPWIDGLRTFGHAVEVIEPFAYVAGHAHVIANAGGLFEAAADPRCAAGAAIGY